MSLTVNPSLEIGEKLFKDLLWDNAVDACLVLLFADQPWMNLPPVKWIVTTITHKATDALFSSFKLFVDLKAISIINDRARDEFTKEALRLKSIAKTKGIDSPEFRKAREDAKAALAKHCHFNG
jgi:hypothetical protein